MSNSSTSTFVEPTDYKKSKTKIWCHYFIDASAQLAKCKLCAKILSVKGGTTSGLIRHTEIKHDIKLKENEAAKASTSATVKTYFKPIDQKRNTLREAIARMCSKDGFTFSVFVTSTDLRNALQALYKDEVIPKSSKTIRSIVMDYAEEVRNAYKHQIMDLQKQNSRFSIEIDEWTSKRNRRYLNTILRSHNHVWNLGLVLIKDSFDANNALMTVTGAVAKFGIKLETDIVAVVTDGPKVMQKFGTLTPTEHQLCLAHAIQLAVIDVLYKTKRDDEERSDSEDLEFEDEGGFQMVEGGLEDMDVIIDHVHYKPLISKCRKIVNMYRRSPQKTENLMKYIKEDRKGDERNVDKALIIDVKTRWNSLHAMLERISDVKGSLQKSLIDVQSRTTLEENDFVYIKNLVAALEILKATVETLCNRNSTLLKADKLLDEALKGLNELGTGISLELMTALENRISERRSVAAGVLQYLHTGCFENKISQNFGVATRITVMDFLSKLLTRLNRISPTEPDIDVGDIEHVTVAASPPSKKTKSTFKTKLYEALDGIDSVAHKEVTTVLDSKSLKASLKKEMNLFEAGGKRGLYLELAYKHLLSIPPTTVENERSFSSAGYLANKIRSRMNDDTLDSLSLLRSYFQLNYKL